MCLVMDPLICGWILRYSFRHFGSQCEIYALLRKNEINRYGAKATVDGFSFFRLHVMLLLTWYQINAV